MFLSRALESTAVAAFLAASVGMAAAQTSPPPPVTMPPAPAIGPANELPPNPADEATPSGNVAPAQPAQMAPVPPNEPQMQNAGAGVPVPEGQTVASLPDAQQKITGATVQSADGTTVGKVARVVAGKDGAPAKVTVAVTGNADIPARAIGIAAEDLHYQPENNIVVAQLTAKEMQAIAAARTPGDVPP